MLALLKGFFKGGFQVQQHRYISMCHWIRNWKSHQTWLCLCSSLCLCKWSLCRTGVRQDMLLEVESSPKKDSEVLALGTCEHDLARKWGRCRCSQAMMRSLGQALIQHDWCPYETGKPEPFTEGESQVRMKAETRVMPPGTPKGCRRWPASHWKLGEASNRFLPQPSEGTSPVDISTSNFEPPERGENKCLLFRPLGVRAFGYGLRKLIHSLRLRFIDSGL